MTVWKKTFVSAFVAQIFSILGFSFAMPFLPFFIADLGIEDPGEQAYWSGIALAAAGLTFALFAPLWGILADRYGRKLMVCRSMFGGFAVLMLMSLARTVGQLIACRLAQGMVTGTIAASVALVASVTPQRRSGLTLGMMQAAVYIGATIGPFFGGFVADAFGYRASFRAGAILCLLGGLLIHFLAEERFDPIEARAKNEVSPGFRELFGIRGFFLAVGIMLGVQLANTLINPSFPLVIKEIVPQTDNINSLAGSVMAAAALAGAVSAALLGHIGDRLGKRPTLIACCLAASTAAVGHFFARSMPALFVARVAFGLAIAGMLPTANAMIHAAIDTRYIGKAYGAASSISMLGIALGPYLGGMLAHAAGLRAPFLATAAMQALMACAVFLAFRPAPCAARQTQDGAGDSSPNP